jgi:hypothetical protein
MKREAWQRFLGHAERVLARPRFDDGYRDWKFELASRVRTLLDVRTEPDQWLSAFNELFPWRVNFRDPRFDLPAPRQVNWLRRWARTDSASLERALDAFEHADRDPVERFATFADRTGQAPAKARVWHGGILAMGSVFNFALAPDSLPMLRGVFFDRVERIVGSQPDSGISLAEAYAHHLAFADEAFSRMRDAGLPIRDMVDVQSVIHIAAREHEFWASDEPEPAKAERARLRAPAGDRTYLAVCAMYQNEAPYLQEWIEFHRLVGVERFFLYDNGSSDNHLEVIAPYIETGTVVLHEWPDRPGQVKANDHCVSEHRYDTRWIATLDIDEFLFSPSGQPVSEVLVDYEEYPGVGVNWMVFGTSGHRTRAPGLLIESHLLRAKEPWSYIKNIVDPARVVRCLQAHAFSYSHQTAVDEHCEPITQWGGRTQFGSVSRLRINHYYLRSEAEGRAKLETPFEGTPRPFRFEQLNRELSEEHDEEITRYVPALKEAMMRVTSEART